MESNIYTSNSSHHHSLKGNVIGTYTKFVKHLNACSGRKTPNAKKFVCMYLYVCVCV